MGRLVLVISLILLLVVIGLTGYPVRSDGGNNATVNLKVTIVPPPGVGGGGGGGGGGPALFSIKTNLFGVEKFYYTKYGGDIHSTIEGTSEDGNLSITIPGHTTALDENGGRLKTLEVAVDETPPDSPEDAHIIGLPYDFGPAGATFDPAISFTWHYDPDALSDRVAEEDLVIAYYDEAAGEWVELECVVDTENNTITASVSHFTTFAILGVVTPEPEPVVEPEPEPVVEPEPALTYWREVVGIIIIGGVVIAGLLIYFLARRRRM